jgi:hypothetical protein
MGLSNEEILSAHRKPAPYLDEPFQQGVWRKPQNLPICLLRPNNNQGTPFQDIPKVGALLYQSEDFVD